MSPRHVLGGTTLKRGWSYLVLRDDAGDLPEVFGFVVDAFFAVGDALTFGAAGAFVLGAGFLLAVLPEPSRSASTLARNVLGSQASCTRFLSPIG